MIFWLDGKTCIAKIEKWTYFPNRYMLIRTLKTANYLINIIAAPFSYFFLHLSPPSPPPPHYAAGKKTFANYFEKPPYLLEGKNSMTGQ